MKGKHILFFLFISISISAQYATSEWQISSMYPDRVFCSDQNSDNIDEIYLSDMIGCIKLEFDGHGFKQVDHINYAGSKYSYTTPAQFFYLDEKLKIGFIDHDSVFIVFDARTFENEYEIILYGGKRSDYVESDTSQALLEVKIADLDGDDQYELVSITNSWLMVQDFLTGEILSFTEEAFGKNGYSGENIAIANTDDDSQKEIITSSGHFYDPVTKSIEKFYTLGFEAGMCVLDIDNDGRDEIFFVRKFLKQVLILDTKFPGLRGTLNFTEWISDITLADVLGDSRKELLVATSGSGKIRIYDSAHFSLLGTVSSNSAQVVTAGDVDGNGSIELISCGGNYFNSPSLKIIDPQGGIIWEGMMTHNLHHLGFVMGSDSRPMFYAVSYNGYIAKWKDFSDVRWFKPEGSIFYQNEFLTNLLCAQTGGTGEYNVLLGTGNYIVNYKNELISPLFYEVSRRAIADAYSNQLLYLNIDDDEHMEVICSISSGSIKIIDMVSGIEESHFDASLLGCSKIHSMYFNDEHNPYFIYYSGYKTEYFQAEDIYQEKGIIGFINYNTFENGIIATTPGKIPYGLAIDDHNEDGEIELYSCFSDGSVMETSLTDYKSRLIYNSEYPISRIKIENVDSDKNKEFLLYGDSFIVYDKICGVEKFRSKTLGNIYGEGSISVVDHDSDNKMNILVAGNNGIFEFEIQEELGNADTDTRFNNDIPDAMLYQNYPNPFNPVTSIEFFLLNEAEVELDIYDALGRHIRNLYKGNKSAGTHKINFNASDLASGLYLYRLKSDNFSEAKKLLLLK